MSLEQVFTKTLSVSFLSLSTLFFSPVASAETEIVLPSAIGSNAGPATGVSYKQFDDGSLKSITSTWAEPVPPGAPRSVIRFKARFAESKAVSALRFFFDRETSGASVRLEEDQYLQNVKIFKDGVEESNETTIRQVISETATEISKNPVDLSGVIKLSEEYDDRTNYVTVVVGFNADTKRISRQGTSGVVSESLPQKSAPKSAAPTGYRWVNPNAKDF